MEYYAILFVSYNDGTESKKAIYTASSVDEATALFHRYMGNYVNGDTVASVTCMAVDNYGNIFHNENWAAES